MGALGRVDAQLSHDGLNDTPPPYRTVVFDCDSTLSALEGIDELAGEHAPAIEALTARAMNGELPLEAVYRLRLEQIRPSRAAVEALGEAYVRALVPGARELVAALRFLGKRVRILSGGLEPAVQRLGAELGLAREHVTAVAIRFDEQGRYSGFDEASPLARSGGKCMPVRAWLDFGEDPLCLVGDGITDLEVARVLPLARFIGYGGVAAREAVLSRARIVVRQPDMRAVAPWLLSARDRRILSRSQNHRDWIASLPQCPS
jgi:phosphoserine phosphatase